jgi:hypothetical protein
MSNLHNPPPAALLAPHMQVFCPWIAELAKFGLVNASGGHASVKK